MPTHCLISFRRYTNYKVKDRERNLTVVQVNELNWPQFD